MKIGQQDEQERKGCPGQESHPKSIEPHQRAGFGLLSGTQIGMTVFATNCPWSDTFLAVRTLFLGNSDTHIAVDSQKAAENQLKEVASVEAAKAGVQELLLILRMPSWTQSRYSWLLLPVSHGL